jgi:hypothetical protein
VRPERISSPMISTAAVTRSDIGNSSRRRSGRGGAATP